MLVESKKRILLLTVVISLLSIICINFKSKVSYSADEQSTSDQLAKDNHVIQQHRLNNLDKVITSTLATKINNFANNSRTIVPLNKLATLKQIKAIAIIGSTASGKTTLVNAIRENCNDVIIPKRYITRKARLNDDLQENSYVSFGVSE